MTSAPTQLPPQGLTVRDFAHALGAPLCALEVVLAAKDQLPPAQGELLEEAVQRLRRLMADAQGER